MNSNGFWKTLADAIAATGTDSHVDRLIDMIGSSVPQDLVTVVRYSVTRKPEFIKHRRYSDEMAGRYLDTYYVFDPFYAYWRRERRPGIVPLNSLADDDAKRGRYIAEFLAQSEICDEVGVLLEDGEDWCLGIFLDRSTKMYRDDEIETLRNRFAVFAALHELDTRAQAPDFRRTDVPAVPGAAPVNASQASAALWPELSTRERELVDLILKGHPNATIATKLGIAAGTVKNHRARIYEKLDITTERELFLQVFQQYHIP
ncbi:helix-turn-helix transcriptional regulator [Sinorhizobium psoraleae]|uniref:helix-turn-helix transcriptional regulator n=1 Tax=Sinorhizobium psoraleae TaxID=520838 RepID=UPI0015680211|nr:helix-turn-helix transcriptional regulator [Sinorhizobium psoraleae]